MIACHGGECCGIKTIHGFQSGPSGPTAIESAIKAKDDPSSVSNNPDAYGRVASSSFNFFSEEAPEESRLDRFKRYVAFLEKKRPAGIIEVALRDVPQPGLAWRDQVRHWAEHLKKAGFRKVCRFKNSNSGYFVQIYHKECKLKKAKAQKPLRETEVPI